ncbi:MAG: tetratricopeptide repeat protein, partial [Dysgonamonadaceae bacterium]|nr:tetratricopeptide repeat protein [Dysgonamonadaceae bacterium]
KTQNRQLEEQLAQTENNYRMMLKYFADNVKDPKQTKIYRNILKTTYEIADVTIVDLKTQAGWSSAYDYRKNPNRNCPENIEQLVFENDEKKLFNFLRSNTIKNADEEQIWVDYLADNSRPDSGKCLAITAITLHLEELFDERKINLLIKESEHPNEEIRQRALTGLLIALRRYDRRLYLYPEIETRLEILAENPEFVNDMCNIILQFILSRETEKISQMMKDEIIPGMMKISPILNDKKRMEDALETGINEKNPEWQNLIEEAGLSERLREFSEMQMEGVDVMHSSFLHLKNFPFFDEMQNWLTPFSKTKVLEGKELRGFADIIAESSILCNSDKYSFFFSIEKIPEKFREMMTGWLSSEIESDKEMIRNELQSTEKHKCAHPIARQYIQDLYRFYKLYPKRTNIEDIFETKPEFYRVESIARFVVNKNNLALIGEHYFNRNHFEEAADIFTRLLNNDKQDETFLQKRGYCRQMLGNIPDALDDYLKADLFNENNPWTNKKIAYCYRVLKQPQKALAYYLRAERLTSGNLALEMNIGHCLLEMNRYDDALKRYFKVEYLSENKERAWRPLAWCSFLCNKYEQAMKYFQKIIEVNPNATDYMNAGHTCLAMGDNKEALKHYTSSIALHNSSYEKFLESFIPDIPNLISAGIEKEIIPLILDGLIYEKNKPQSQNKSREN